MFLSVLTIGKLADFPEKKDMFGQMVNTGWETVDGIPTYLLKGHSPYHIISLSNHAWSPYHIINF